MSEISEFSLLDSHEIESAWWSQCKKLDGVSGTFVYEPGKSPMVRVLIEAPFSFEFKFSGNLYGRLTNGMYITLWNIYISRESISVSQLQKFEISGTHALIGREVYKNKDITFTQCKIEYESLSNLFDYRPLSTTMRREVSSGQYEASWTHLSRQQYTSYLKTQKTRISILNGFTQKQESGGFRVLYRDYIKIKPSKKQDIWWFLGAYRSLELLFEVLSQKTMLPRFITLQRMQRKDKYAEENLPLYVLGRIDVDKLNLKAKSYATKPLLPNSNLHNYLSGWFDLDPFARESFERMRDILFENRTTEKEISLILQSFEVAFNNLPSSRLISKAGYRRVRKLIMSSLSSSEDASPDLVDAIDRALQHANSSKLADKLAKASQSIASEQLTRIFGADSSKEIQFIVSIRNDYTHGKKLKENVTSSREIRLKSIAIFRFVWLLLLLKIGVDIKIVEYERT